MKMGAAFSWEESRVPGLVKDSRSEPTESRARGGRPSLSRKRQRAAGGMLNPLSDQRREMKATRGGHCLRRMDRGPGVPASLGLATLTPAAGPGKWSLQACSEAAHMVKVLVLHGGHGSDT